MNNNVPYSPRLNEFVLDWFSKNAQHFHVYHNFKFDLSNPDKVFQHFTDHWNVHGTIPMWYDDNDDNIFGDREVNAKFRAWHDYMHIVNGFDFSLEGEIKTYHKQQKLLPQMWYWERLLLQSEIIGQGVYYTFSEKPIESQRQFTMDFIFHVII